MGKMQKSPNYSLMKMSKKAAVSETESESSSEEETNIPLLNIVNKIKTEPQSSSGDSDSESDKNQVFTQKDPLKNTNCPPISSEQEKSTKAIKKEAEQTLDSDASANKQTFQTNKYIISKSFNTKTVNKKPKPISQDSDESSSSREQDTLRGAFLGQVKAKSKKKSPASKLQSKQKLPVTRESGSSYSEDSNDDVENKKVPFNTSLVQKQKLNVKDTSKLSPESLKNLPRSVQTNPKNTQEKRNRKNSRKSDPNIPENNENIRNNVEDSNNKVNPKQSSTASTDTVSIEGSSNSHLAKTNKVQVLQHIKFTPMKPKELLQDLYPDLTTANIKDVPNISDGEEVYLLRIPKTVDPQQLLNKEVDLIFGSKVKLGSEKYEFVPANKAPDPILLVGNQSKTVQPKNTLFLKKYIKSPKLPDLELIEKAMIPLPENLKPRHPLFGSNYIDKIQLSSSVELRLQKAIDDCLKEKVKKKNKKKKLSSNIVENDMNEVIFSLLGNHIAQKPSPSEEHSDSAFGSSESHNSSKKKTKIKSGDSKESTMYDRQMQVEVEDEVSPNKKKKHKLNKSTNSEWRVNNVEPAVKHQEPFRTELSIISSVDQPLKKSHKQKDEKINKSSPFGDRSMFESTRIEGIPSTSSKKESIINETINRIKTELLTEYESEWDETLMRKKKKKKRKSLPEELQDKMQTGNINCKEQEMITPWDSDNSKMRERSALVNKIKTELLTEYESEWDEKLMIKKKKRKSLPEEAVEKIENENVQNELTNDFELVMPKISKSSMSPKRMKTELLTEYESEWDETLMMKKKKKKRKSDPEGEEKNENNNNTHSIKDDLNHFIPNIRKRSKSINQIKTELLTEYESEWDEALMTKKKKKKRKSIVGEEENIQNEIIDNIKQQILVDFKPSSKKMKKKSMSTL